MEGDLLVILLFAANGLLPSNSTGIGIITSDWGKHKVSTCLLTCSQHLLTLSEYNLGPYDIWSEDITVTHYSRNPNPRVAHAGQNTTFFVQATVIW